MCNINEIYEIQFTLIQNLQSQTAILSLFCNLQRQSTVDQNYFKGGFELSWVLLKIQIINF